MWKYNNVIAQAYTPNCSEKKFEIKKVKNNVPWTYGNNDINSKEVFEMFYKKQFQKKW